MKPVKVALTCSRQSILFGSQKMKNSIKHLYLNKEMDELVNNSILSTGFCGLQCSEDTLEYVASFIEHSYLKKLDMIMTVIEIRLQTIHIWIMRQTLIFLMHHRQTTLLDIETSWVKMGISLPALRMLYRKT